VFDPKGELWGTTAGFRSRLGPALFFNPLHPATARFNPLAEIGTGDRAISDVQKLVAILAEPGGASGHQDFWDKQGSEMLSALILHALYTETAENKSLVGVKRLSADLDATAKAMATTLHRRDCAAIMSAIECRTRHGSRHSPIRPASFDARPDARSICPSSTTPASDVSTPPSNAALTFLPAQAGKANGKAAFWSMAVGAQSVWERTWSKHPFPEPVQQLVQRPPANSCSPMNNPG
jgi:hypothetical protein